MKDDGIVWDVTSRDEWVHLTTVSKKVEISPESALALSAAIARHAQDAIRMRARRLSEAAQAKTKQENARHQ